MAFARRVFFLAGLYGVLILVPQYFMEAKLGRDFPPPMNHPEYFYGFLGVALAWQVLFFLVAQDPARLRPAIIPAILEKLGFGAAAVMLFAQGRLGGPLFVAGLVDFVFAFLFSWAYRRIG